MKILNIFKSKKSKSEVVEELKKDFDKKIKDKKKSDEEYYKEKEENSAIFEKLMNTNFYNEIDELMKHFDKKTNPLTKAQKCGYKIDKTNLCLEFYSHGYDQHPVIFQYFSKNKEILIGEKLHETKKDKYFAVKKSRDAEKYFLKLMMEHMGSKIE